MRVVAVDARHVGTGVVVVGDAVLVAITDLLRGVRDHQDAAEVRGADARGKARPEADARLEVVEEAVTAVEEQLQVGGALLHVGEGEGPVELGAELDVALVAEQHPGARAPLELAALGDAAVRVGGLDLRPARGGPHQPLRDATAEDELRQAAHLPVADERVLGAGGEPHVAAHRDLEGIEVVAPETDAGAHPEVAELGAAGRGEGLAGAHRRVVAVLVEGDRDVDVDVEPAPQREPTVEVEEELVLDDRPDVVVPGGGLDDQGVVGVVGQQHQVRGELARGVGGLHPEHAVAGGRRIEAIEGQARLGQRRTRCRDQRGRRRRTLQRLPQSRSPHALIPRGREIGEKDGCPLK